MITRCPECATAFRVTQAQLQARKGKVRCGHCGEVFDAIEALESLQQRDGADAQAQPSDTGQPQQGNGESAAAEAALPAPGEDKPLAGPGETARGEADRAAAAEQPPSTQDRPAAAAAPMPEPSPEPAFGRRSGRATFGWSVAAALLLVLLNLQAVFYFRGAIALVWPAARPYIEQLCAPLGCDIPLPKRAELMSIEASDLQAHPASPGVMILSATIRNRAAFPQAFPALELTLTDERDQPLARRVLLPEEYLKPDRANAVPSCAGGVAACEVQLRLFLEAAGLAATGYRLYLFYP